MLCSSGTEMSPRKKPKFSVAASSTKNPKMTFSRFIDHPLRDRRQRRTAGDGTVIENDHPCAEISLTRVGAGGAAYHGRARPDVDSHRTRGTSNARERPGRRADR